MDDVEVVYVKKQPTRVKNDQVFLPYPMKKRKSEKKKKSFNYSFKAFGE